MRKHREFVPAALALIVFVLVGTRLIVSPLDAPFALAFGLLLIGIGLAAASARVLDHFRSTRSARQAALRALSARLMSVQEEERRRLSQELHDGLSQSLTAVSSYLWLVERQLPDHLGSLRTPTAEARRLVTKTLGEMRELSQLLCPPVLTLCGLVPSLDAHLNGFADRFQIGVSLTAEGLPERLPPDMEMALYRITQEALTNVARHARARRVHVLLRADASQIRLEVQDDGVGLGATNGTGTQVGTGLVGISERARALGGTMTIDFGPGTRLRVCVPRPEERAGEGLAGDGVSDRAEEQATIPRAQGAPFGEQARATRPPPPSFRHPTARYLHSTQRSAATARTTPRAWAPLTYRRTGV